MEFSELLRSLILAPTTMTVHATRVITKPTPILAEVGMSVKMKLGRNDHTR